MTIKKDDNVNAKPSERDAGAPQNNSSISTHIFAAIIYFIGVVGFIYAAGGKLSGTGTSEFKGLGYLQAIPEYGPYFLVSCVPLWIGVATWKRGLDKSKYAWIWILLGLAASGAVLWLVPIGG